MCFSAIWDNNFLIIHQLFIMQKNDLSFSFATMWQLTWPQILVMFFFFCIGLCDVWAAGQLGKDIQAGFGIVAQGAIFLQVLALAIGSGATAAISQSLGAKRQARACRYIAMVLLLTLSIGILVAIAAFVGNELFLSLLQTPQDVLPIALYYSKVTLITMPLSYVFSSSTSLFRATRQVIPPIFVAATMCIGNFIGNLGFGLGYFGLPSYGYIGIAWTTFACTLFGAACNVLLLIQRGYFDYKKFPPLRWIRAALPYLLKVAIPAGASQFVWQSGYIVLFSVVASLPFDNVHALAGLTAGMRLEALLFLPGMAFSMTAAVLVGNSLGANNIPQAYRLARILVVVGASCMSIVAAMLWPFIPYLAAILSTSPETQEITRNYMYFNIFSTPFTLASMILGGVMTGAGATKYNLMVYGSSFWLIRLPIAWIFGHYIWQSASGVFLGMVLSQVVQSTIMVVVLYKANWTRFAMNSGHKKQ